jgi:hypothetical protein
MALLVIVVCGALGAFASDLVADGGHLVPWAKSDGGWSLGFVGKLVVGAVAAVVILALNPADEWWQLIGSALAAGVGGEAILLSIVAARKAVSAEKDRDHAEARAAGVTALARERLATLKVAALGGSPPADLADLADEADPLETISKSVPGGGTKGFSFREAAVEDRGRARTVALLADRFSAELAAFTTAGGSVRDRVRAILVKNLGHSDVETRPLGEIGGKDPGVRRLIARDIRTKEEWKDVLNPPWQDSDVKESSTLGSLANEIDLRGGV